MSRYTDALHAVHAARDRSHAGADAAYDFSDSVVGRAIAIVVEAIAEFHGGQDFVGARSPRVRLGIASMRAGAACADLVRFGRAGVTRFHLPWNAFAAFVDLTITIVVFAVADFGRAFTASGAARVSPVSARAPVAAPNSPLVSASALARRKILAFRAGDDLNG